MIKKHQKWIALLVAITFAWLLYVSTMPLAASDNTEAGQASVERAPGFVEQQGPEWGPGNKKRATHFIIIVIVGYVALSLLYFLIRGIDIEAAPREGISNSKASRLLIPPNRT